MNVQELIEQLNDIEDKTKDMVYMTPDGFISIGYVCESKMFENVVVIAQDKI